MPSSAYISTSIQFGFLSVSYTHLVLLEAGDRWIIAGDETEWEEKLTERFISIVSRMTEGSFEERALKIREVVP